MKRWIAWFPRSLVACVLLMSMTATPTLSAEPAGRFIDLPGGVKLWMIDTGGVGETIILLHPRTGYSAIWEHQIAAFTAAGLRVIAPDKPGAGQSIMSADIKPVTYTETLDALVDHLKIERFILLGVAEGGYFAFDYAAWKPEKVRKLILGATGLGVQVDQEGSNFRRNAAIPGFEKLPPDVRELSPTYRGFNPEGVRRWLEIEHHAAPENLPRQVMRTPNTIDKLANLKMPVLVIAGDVDLTTPSGAIRLWAKHLPKHEFKLITEAGHAVMWEQPAAFNETVLEFIRR